MKIMKLAACITTMLVLTHVNAANAAMTVPFGWYLETNQGESIANSKSYPGSSIDRKGYGYNFDGGYKFNPWFSAEIGYSGFANTVIKNSAGAQAAKDEHYSYDISGKLMLPVGGTGAELFGKLGVARVNSNVKVNYANAALNNLTYQSGVHDTTGVYLAAGADYGITPHVLVNVEGACSRGNNKTGNLYLYSGGLSYIF